MRIAKTALALVMLLVMGFADQARAQDDESQLLAEARTIAHIVATSGVAGELGLPVCSADVDVEAANFDYLTPALHRLTEAPDQPLLFDTGSLLTPGALARHAAREAPEALAEMLDELGYRALVFGPNELAAVRGPMIAAFRALRERGIPGIASNLFCMPDTPAVELCDVLVDGGDGPSIHLVNDQRVALVSIMPGDTLAALAPARAAGLRTTPPLEGLTSAVRQARAAGADIVVAVLDHGANAEDPAGKAIELATALPEDARPDLLFAAGAGNELVFARPSTVQPAIVAAPMGGALDVRIREDYRSAVHDVMARPVTPSPRIAPDFARWSLETGREYCAQWGNELPGANLSRDITGREFLELSSGVMRERAGTELGIIDNGLLAARWHPARPGALTASDVFVGLRYDEQIVVADVPAAWLEKVAKKLEDGYLIVPGLEWDGKKAKVNGRPLEARATYRVATLHFLAAGGAGALPDLPAGYSWEALEDASIRAVLFDFLDVPREGDPRDALSDRRDALEWIFRVDLDARLAGTSVNNPTDDAGDPIYTASQLGRSDSVTFGFTSQLRADSASRTWGWENEGIARYRTTQTNADPFAEGDDILSVRSTVAYRRFRSDLPRFYIPEPYVEAYLESEMSQPDTRDYHHLQLRPTGGFRFNFTEHLTLKLGAGITSELLDPMREARFGLSAQLVLKQWSVMVQEDRKLATEFTFDYFVTGENQELRGRWDTTLDIAGPFQMVFGFQLFSRKEPGQDPGFAFDITAGLRVAWLGRVAP
ncbi:MAG: hypothetical protein DRJ42_27695 [Deltaproteobacteria bacterium]|nr:MAG: hypothetical protein DRJ42_27695 [Deltaproteobacteria bacterium]